MYDLKVPSEPSRRGDRVGDDTRRRRTGPARPPSCPPSNAGPIPASPSCPGAARCTTRSARIRWLQWVVTTICLMILLLGATFLVFLTAVLR